MYKRGLLSLADLRTITGQLRRTSGTSVTRWFPASLQLSPTWPTLTVWAFVLVAELVGLALFARGLRTERAPLPRWGGIDDSVVEGDPAFMIGRAAKAIPTFACLACLLTACGGSGSATKTTTTVPIRTATLSTTTRAFSQRDYKRLKSLLEILKGMKGGSHFCVILSSDPHTHQFTGTRCKHQLRSYFRVQISGAAGPLHLGMTRAAALRSLGSSAYALNQGGVNCALYDIGIGTQRGSAAACFDRTKHLIAFNVSGHVFCFNRSACVDGKTLVPRSIRAGMRTVFDSNAGLYLSYRRLRLLGRSYELVMDRPASDAPGTVRTVGFAPCGRNAAIGYYVPVNCY